MGDGGGFLRVQWERVGHVRQLLTDVGGGRHLVQRYA